MANNWYVITGGPSTGKTTLLAKLEELGHRTVPEAARLVIDEGLAKGLTLAQIRADERAFQHEVLKVKDKIEAELDKDVLTFLDRGMHDTIAYVRDYGFEFEDWMHELFQKAKYRQVFLLEPLSTYIKDYARTEDEAFTRRIHQLLHDAYAEFGMTPIHIPPLGLEERVRFVLDRVKQEWPA